MQDYATRRVFLRTLGASAVGAVPAVKSLDCTVALADQAASDNRDGVPARFRYCLNTSTIRGQNLNLSQQIAVAAEAGYTAIEPWMRDIHQFVADGGKLSNIRQQLEDAGLEVPSAIGFARWIVDDPSERTEALAVARRDMELLREIGGTRIAAPPVGATDRSDLELRRIVDRYRALLELGQEVGVVPQLELWGFSQTLSRVGEVAYVIAEAAHPASCALLDVYHIYKGGSDFQALRLFSRSVLHVLHINDYPADPPREKIQDKDRVFPGDGVAPLSQMLRLLHEAGTYPILSLELFNAEYWKRDALDVARTGLAKMRAAVEKAFQEN